MWLMAISHLRRPVEIQKGFGRCFLTVALRRSTVREKQKLKYTIQFGITPHVKSKLKEDIFGSPFAFKFDETTTAQVKKQYDGYVTYHSPLQKNVITSYTGSLFVGHCTAADLLDHFLIFIKDLGIDTNLMMGIGMDGPNVNKQFEADLIKKLDSEKGNSIMKIGSCPLHIVNNAFGEGMKTIKAVMDIEQFLIDLLFFFKLSSAGREDYKELEEMTDVTAEFMLRYCSTRWLFIGKAVLRVMEQMDNLKLYFLTKLPTLAGFKGKKGVGSTERYQRIKKMLNNDLLLPCMSFVVYTSLIFKPFVLLFQKEEPMIHMLFPQMKKLLQDLLVKFVDQKVLKNLENINAIMEYDVNNADNYNVQRDIGTKTCSLLTKVVKDNLVKKKFVEAVTNFYTASTAYLIRNLPLGKQVLIDAQYLHSNCRRKNVEKPLLRLVGEVY